MKILIVDDEVIYLRFLQESLYRTKNVIVDIDSSPYSALRKVIINDYDLVISDNNMPDYDGISMLKEIKRFKPDSKVVIHTGYLSSDIVCEAEKYGVYRILEKNDNALLEIIAEIKNKTLG